ncbi:MAG TPA: hypothetical protein VK083_07715 [Nocardia sp.]|uniref:hypothetical protein n=1 Tax=Nocardia sp. TaxID=1821 RepID=UPI002B4B32F0|nr:hypothetical protein [Nocardia sp.]HLS76657.1 hypothetical protein [Nocardia sp.]
MSERRGTRRTRTRRRTRAPAPRPDVAERLATVDRLLDGEVTAADGVWSRATAWILRLALEQAVDELWHRVAPELARCPMRAQLLALRIYAGPDLAAEVAALWAALSRAAHHHDYDLAPAVADLRRWREQTAARAAELHRAGRPVRFTWVRTELDRPPG